MYLLDTNIVSDARRRSPQIISWLRGVDSRALFLSVITLGEIARSIGLKQRIDPNAAAALMAWLQALRADHTDRILPITDDVAMIWGRLTAERPRGDADGLIAATARHYDLILVTRNVRHFLDAGINVVNPWDGSPG